MRCDVPVPVIGESDSHQTTEQKVKHIPVFIKRLYGVNIRYY